MRDVTYLLPPPPVTFPLPPPKSSPEQDQEPLDLSDPEIPKDAKSFLDVKLPTLPDSDLAPVYDTCTKVRSKISKLINNQNPEEKD
jgi:hypothetical protein